MSYLNRLRVLNSTEENHKDYFSRVCFPAAVSSSPSCVCAAFLSSPRLPQRCKPFPLAPASRMPILREVSGFGHVLSTALCCLLCLTRCSWSGHGLFLSGSAGPYPLTRRDSARVSTPGVISGAGTVAEIQ